MASEAAVTVSLAKCHIYPDPEDLVSNSGVQNFIKVREEFFGKRTYPEITINDNNKVSSKQYYIWHGMLSGENNSNKVPSAFYDCLVHLLNKFQRLLPQYNVALFFENSGPLSIRNLYFCS